MTTKLLKSIAFAGVGAVLGIVSSTALLGTAAAAPSHAGVVHAARHKTRHHHPHSRIPQHNGGDHDSDNRGGPTDGDGNV